MSDDAVFTGGDARYSITGPSCESPFKGNENLVFYSVLLGCLASLST